MAVRKRGSYWWYDFRCHIHKTRHRASLREARTKAQAEQAEANKRLECFGAAYGQTQKQTPRLSEFIDKTYMTWAKTNKKSWRDDELICGTIKAHFKAKRIADISPMDVERFKKVRHETPTRHEEARSPSTVNRELTILSRVMALAVDAGHISENPCRRVRRFKEDNERIRFLTEDEEARLMKQIGGRELLRSVVIFALNTGLRRGEIFSLRWSEVDWSRNFIHVINTKTGKSRIIPLNDATRDVLLRQQKKSESEFVFVSPRTGARLRNLRNSFGKACEDAKVLNFHFHDLRHTFASRLADAGVDAFTIAELMGHSTLEMTKRYTHVTDERKRKAVAALKKPARKVVTIWSQKQKRQAV
ncbi:MAG TPA: site-specific integrase [Pyrinomonadaceae bacterium]